MKPEAIPVFENEAEKMHIRICEVIRNWIAQGKYRPGKRLESIRKIAKDFGVSPVTVLKALDILEEEKLILRVPMKGTFVAPASASAGQNLDICFAFPEEQFTPDMLGEENYRICFEYLRGIWDAVSCKNATLQMIYFKDDKSPETLEHQVRRLQQFDVVIFPSLQLKSLSVEIAKTTLTFLLNGDIVSDLTSRDIHQVSLDYRTLFRKVAKHISDCGFKQAGLLDNSCESSKGCGRKTACCMERIRGIREACHDFGVEIPQKYIWNLNDIDSLIRLLKKGDFPEIFYCVNVQTVGMIYEAAYRTGLVVGKDFQLIGQCSEIYARDQHPSLTHFSFPRYEIGKHVVETAMNALRNREPVGIIPAFPPIFSQGKSTTLSSDMASGQNSNGEIMLCPEHVLS